MSGMKAFVHTLHRQGREADSIAFFLAKRGIVPTIEIGYDIAQRYVPRCDVGELLKIGKRASQL
jgi:hypothetical protein